MFDFNILFLYFIIYSIIGWCCETIYCRILDGKFSDRGFLYGPYCPIYGFGGLIVSTLLSQIKQYPVFLFISSILLTTILEYLTSFIMEKIFNAKWWDYSNMKFNLNGRICLLNSTLFGIMAIFLTYFIQPYIEKLVALIPQNIIPHTINILLIAISVDFAFSLNSIINLKNKLHEFRELATTFKQKQKSKIEDKIYIKQLSDLKLKLSEKNSFANNRLLKAFPTLKFNKFNDELIELKEFLENKKKQRTEEKERLKNEKLKAKLS